MARLWLALTALLSLSGCEQQIRLGVEQTISTVPTILEDFVLINLHSIASNRYAVIQQATLKESVSNAQNSYDYGVAPNIALRAIAVTGLVANASNSLSENWVVNPITRSLDQRRLQLLFGYAVRSNGNVKAKYEDLVTNIVNVGNQSTEEEKLKLRLLLRSYVPELPDGPFATVDDSNCNEKLDYSHSLPLTLERVCFKAMQGLSGKEIASMLVLWSLAVPEFSQEGGSKETGSGVAIPVSPRVGR